MPAISASAPGKAILFGEHAVVYGRPAIAVPVQDIQARALVMAEPRAAPGRVRIQAPRIGQDADLDALPLDDPIAMAVRLVFSTLGIARLPACTVRITSTIPIAAGLGSGAAVSVAVLRAVSSFAGHPLSAEQVSALAYEVEKRHHGTPSGIDNTVITYARPVFFVRGQPVETFDLSAALTLVIGDTGISSPTALAVGDLRRRWQAQPDPYEAIFDAVGEIVHTARRALQDGDVAALGPLMNDNHTWLQRMGVSCPELDRLVEAARDAGASGAKLSGGGRGGNMIALATAQTAQAIAERLLAGGATRVIISQARRSSVL